MAAILLLSVTLICCTIRSPYDEINDKIIVLFQQGKYSEAEKLAKEVLPMTKEKFGEDHPKVAASLVTLAMIYKTREKYVEAEPLYKKALAIQEKTLGPDYSDVVHELQNMVELYKAMGKDDEAKKLTARIEKIQSH
jgi:tetratricopeptide (TPR) repeat protein